MIGFDPFYNVELLIFIIEANFWNDKILLRVSKHTFPLSYFYIHFPG